VTARALWLVLGLGLSPNPSVVAQTTILPIGGTVSSCPEIHFSGTETREAMSIDGPYKCKAKDGVHQVYKIHGTSLIQRLNYYPGTVLFYPEMKEATDATLYVDSQGPFAQLARAKHRGTYTYAAGVATVECSLVPDNSGGSKPELVYIRSYTQNDAPEYGNPEGHALQLVSNGHQLEIDDFTLESGDVVVGTSEIINDNSPPPSFPKPKGEVEKIEDGIESDVVHAERKARWVIRKAEILVGLHARPAEAAVRRVSAGAKKIATNPPPVSRPAPTPPPTPIVECDQL
jgi:hypothetical protein